MIGFRNRWTGGFGNWLRTPSSRPAAIGRVSVQEGLGRLAYTGDQFGGGDDLNVPAPAHEPSLDFDQAAQP